jgi:toxin ParE1/3/4
MEEDVREVVVSEFVHDSLRKIFQYGAETFYVGHAAALIEELYEKINSLSSRHLQYPICKSLAPKSGIYRNIIHKNYLVIYRITKNRVEVLDVIHNRRHPSKIKAVRKIRL